MVIGCSSIEYTDARTLDDARLELVQRHSWTHGDGENCETVIERHFGRIRRLVGIGGELDAQTVGGQRGRDAHGVRADTRAPAYLAKDARRRRPNPEASENQPSRARATLVLTRGERRGKANR